ncbi:hypothetical protein DOK67_0001501 [Enterococcus sp. DIV0212c]|uniref:DUF916 and DUF3324 domain-containing protein n=1 Tax=Enterococcus sp. DIV0212c TaxID=2230867 RepID=UPI001A9BFD04|nr:DUF916 and DUF3324 domain-containing protein [Enterococcus sp. DIV0212c]MBO1354292.1 DUF916 and DUF3324 domain-containing protein [Enterococcus sp. DIV0212c]
MQNVTLKIHTSLFKKSFFLFCLITVLCFLSPVNAYAEGEESNLSVKAELPDNQLTKDAGYYDLEVKPGQTQELTLKVYNMGDKETTAKIEINPAYTGASGSFVYALDASKRDESMKLPLSDIAKTDEFISIPAKSEADVKINLTIPTEPFEGIVYGGIRVTDAEGEKEGSSKAEKEDSGFSIANKYAYTIAMRVRENEELPKSDLKVKKIVASQVVGRNAVKVNLQNPTPTIIDKVTYDAKIMKKGSSDVLHEHKVSNYRVAPNTNFDYAISWDNKPFEAGSYQLEMTAKSEVTGQTWNFKQNFTISAKEAKELNEKAVDLEKDYMKYIIYGAIGAAILLLLIIILLVTLSKKRKKKQRRKKGKGKRPANKKGKEASNGSGKQSSGAKRKPAGKSSTQSGKRKR